MRTARLMVAGVAGAAALVGAMAAPAVASASARPMDPTPPQCPVLTITHNSYAQFPKVYNCSYYAHHYAVAFTQSGTERETTCVNIGSKGSHTWTVGSNAWGFHVVSC